MYLTIVQANDNFVQTVSVMLPIVCLGIKRKDSFFHDDKYLMVHLFIWVTVFDLT